MTESRSIAIIGMSCSFPGSPDVETYWRTIRDGAVHFREVPADRWDHSLFHSTNRREADATYAKKVACLHDIRSFSPERYGIPPRRAVAMDPQQRLILDQTRLALDDAGYGGRSLPRSTGVYIGASVSEYKDLMVSRVRARQILSGQLGEAPALPEGALTSAVGAVGIMQQYSLVGGLLNMIACNVNAAFDLQGPSLVVDTACSSTLTALHEAMLHLRQGICEAAIVGGVYAMCTPDMMVAFSKIGALSKSDVCRPFDSNADGFVLGEGAGVVVLKRLDDAMRDGDRIWAVIRGVGLCNDGRGEGPMTPRVEGQAEALARAYRDADVCPGTVGYIEAHGTATPVADMTEIRALRQNAGSKPAEPVRCAVASVKANIGHTLAAAGIASIIKSVLVLDRRTIPPQAGLQSTREGLGLEGSGFYVPTLAEPLSGLRGAPRRVGVNAFGFGGTNVHVVLEEAPQTGPTSNSRYANAEPVSLPSTPASVRSFWIVDDKKRETASAGFRTSSGSTSEAVGQELCGSVRIENPRTQTSPTAGEAMEIAARVIELAAEVSSYPIRELIPGKRLGSDLGFDSLMAVDLYVALTHEFPSAGEIPQDVLGGDITIQELISRVVELITPARNAPAEVKEPQLASDCLSIIPTAKRGPSPFNDRITIAGEVPRIENHPKLGSKEIVFPSVPGQAVAEAGGMKVGGCTTGKSRTIPPPSEVLDPVAWQIAKFPEVVAIRKRVSDLQNSGMHNPYFSVHESVASDTSMIGGREYVNFSSYNYLGLSGDPEITAFAIDALKQYGSSVSASRLVSGEKPLHRELEREIANFLGCEDAIAMVGGHATNVTVIGQLVGPQDMVVHDSLAHDSILTGIKLSGAKRRPFPHNDMNALEQILRQSRGSVRRVLIVVEGVYSMDGDIAPLPALIDIKRRHHALLMVDEAHSLGVLGATGRGIGEHFQVRPEDVDLWMGTLSKSLASCGGYIAGCAELVEYLKYSNSGFVYSVGLSPANAGAALAALRKLRAHPELVTAVRERSRLFLELSRQYGIDTGMSDGSAVVPCIVGSSHKCLLLSRALGERGINVQPILYPAVDEKLTRLRFFVTARHSEEQIRRTVVALAEALGRMTPRALKTAADTNFAGLRGGVSHVAV